MMAMLSIPIRKITGLFAVLFPLNDLSFELSFLPCFCSCLIMQQLQTIADDVVLTVVMPNIRRRVLSDRTQEFFLLYRRIQPSGQAQHGVN
jgi:hypothetical protein